MVPLVVGVVASLVAAWLIARRRQARRERELAQMQRTALPRQAKPRQPGLQPKHRYYTEMAGLHIGVTLLVGDSHTTFGPGEIITACVAGRPATLPEDWDTVAPKLIERAEEAARERGAVFFDGQTYSLLDYRLEAVDPVSEYKVLHLKLGKSTYYHYVTTNLALDLRVLSEDNRLLTPREKYAIYDPHRIRDLPLSNQLAVNMNVVTSDDCLVVQRRSDRVGNYLNTVASGVNASMTRGDQGSPKDEDDEGRPDPFSTVRREAYEELGLEDKAITDIEFHGLGVELAYFQPLLFGELRTEQTSDELIRRARFEARDKFEYRELQCIPLEAETIGRHLFADESQWVAVTALALVFSLLHRHGYEHVESAFRSLAKAKIIE